MSDARRSHIAAVREDIAAMLDRHDASMRKKAFAARRAASPAERLKTIALHIDNFLTGIKADIEALQAKIEVSDVLVSDRHDEANEAIHEGLQFVQTLRRSIATKAPIVWLLSEAGSGEYSVFHSPLNERVTSIAVKYKDGEDHKRELIDITLLDGNAYAAWIDVEKHFELSIVPMTYECVLAEQVRDDDGDDEEVHGLESGDEEEEVEPSLYLYPISTPKGDPLRIYSMHDPEQLKRRGANPLKTLYRDCSCDARNIMSWSYTTFNADVTAAEVKPVPIEEYYAGDDDAISAAEKRGATFVVTMHFVVATPIVTQ